MPNAVSSPFAKSNFLSMSAIFHHFTKAGARLLCAVVLLTLVPLSILAQEMDAAGESVIKVTLLGVGGGPEGGLFGPGDSGFGINYSTLVEIEDVAFLFDAGRGSAEQIAKLGSSYFQKVDKLYLTHLHGDHNLGVPDLWLTPVRVRQNTSASRTVPLQVFGPAGTKDMADHIFAAFKYNLLYNGTVDAESVRLIGTDITQGVVYDQDGITVTAFDVDHTPPRDRDNHEQFPALGYRVDYGDRSVVISGDTRFSENLIDYSMGVDVLIHEVGGGGGGGGRGGEGAGRQGGGGNRQGGGQGADGQGGGGRGNHHTSIPEAAEIFNRVEPKLAVYSHIVIGADQRLTEETRSANYNGPLLVGHELDVIMIGEEVTTTRVGNSN